MNTLYTLGYSGLKPEDLGALAEGHDLVILDIRCSPRSRNPVWTKKRLAERLGERYVHLRALGNTDYKGDTIRIADLEAGIREAAAYLERQSVVLLCACKDVRSCHRLPVAERLAAETGAPLVHLSLADAARMAAEVSGSPVQASLFDEAPPGDLSPDREA